MKKKIIFLLFVILLSLLTGAYAEDGTYSEKLINEAENKSAVEASDDNLDMITGTLRELFIEDGMGESVQCLVLDVDVPRKLPVTDIFGETFIEENDVEEIQIAAKNFVSDMNGARVKITSYDEIFEGHNVYHIRSIVIGGAVLEIIKDDVSVTLNGVKINFDQPPIIVDDRTLVPLRAVFEAFGATVDWNEETQTVTSSKGNTTISMTIGDFQMYKNGEKFVLEVAPQIVGNRTLVPIRALAQSFNIKVDWNEKTKTVLLNEY